jgi:hypothetical protein
VSTERDSRDQAHSSKDDSSDSYPLSVPARERDFYLALAPSERSGGLPGPHPGAVHSSTGGDGDPQDGRHLGTGLKARFSRLKRVPAEQARHRSSARASKALHIGIGTAADLDILYEEQEPAIREKLLTLGIRRVLEPNVQGYRLWYWASRILACPPNGEVSDRDRKELADRAALENPYERLRRQRPRLTTKEREDALNEWIVEQLCGMYLNRNDERELRREVADRVPTDPAQQREYRRAWHEANDARRRTSS